MGGATIYQGYIEQVKSIMSCLDFDFIDFHLIISELIKNSTSIYVL